MSREEIEWEDIGIFPDCAFAALGDPSLLDDEGWVEDSLPALRLRESGAGMLYGLGECDGLPVEIARRSGVVVGARLEFTDDVAALEAAGEGRWVAIGTLHIGGEGAVAVDKKHEHVEGYLHHPAASTGVISRRGVRIGLGPISAS